jgi:hypothetical protein
MGESPNMQLFEVNSTMHGFFAKVPTILEKQIAKRRGSDCGNKSFSHFLWFVGEKVYLCSCQLSQIINPYKTQRL